MNSHKVKFHVLAVGFDFWFVTNFWDRIERQGEFKVSHILHPSFDLSSVKKNGFRDNLYCLRNNIRQSMPLPDIEFLAALESPDLPTVHNMIMSDRVLCRLGYSEALAYASFVARRLEELLLEIKPSFVICGFDGLHGSMVMAVAKFLKLPCYAMTFSTIPPGLTAFCSGLQPNKTVFLGANNPADLKVLAEKTLAEFEKRSLVVPAYLSANNMVAIFKRFPAHLRALSAALKRTLSSQFDQFTDYPLGVILREYIRKRKNLFFLSKVKFLESPPVGPFIFLGLHMQPESSIDVWAPFFSDQFSVIEAIARSTPPSVKILVKLHKSDADNYSSKQLERLAHLPGVQLVSPFANSREFIEKTALVVAIQGNIALEAALLGRPVLIFGDSNFEYLPSVTKVGRITDLPSQIRAKLVEPPVSREDILAGFSSYLRNFLPGCYNDWNFIPKDNEIAALVEQFKLIHEMLDRDMSCVG